MSNDHIVKKKAFLPAFSSVLTPCSALLFGVSSGCGESQEEVRFIGLVTPGMSGSLGGVRVRGDDRHCSRNFLS